LIGTFAANQGLKSAHDVVASLIDALFDVGIYIDSLDVRLDECHGCTQVKLALTYTYLTFSGNFTLARISLTLILFRRVTAISYRTIVTTCSHPQAI
jgi:hypothetical protein